MKTILLVSLFFGLTAFADLSTPDKAMITPENLLSNPGAENGKASFTASGGTFITTTVNKSKGNAAFSWDSSATAQTVTSRAIPVSAGVGLSLKNVAASFQFKCATGACTHKIQLYDGTNVLAESSIASVTDHFTPTTVTGGAPSSGNLYLRLVSVASNEPVLYFDSGFLGLAEEYNLFQVSQATFVGSAYIASTAACTWTRTSATLGAFSTTAACPGPTVDDNPGPGVIQTTDTDLPQFTINNLPPGRYRVVISGVGRVDNAVRGVMAVSDGTTTQGHTGANSGNTLYALPFTVVGWFSYSTSGNKTFSLFTSSETGVVTAYADTSLANVSLRFSIERFPTTTELGFRADQLPASWSGYHDSDCAFSRTNTAYGNPAADASCTFTERTNSNFGTVTSYLSGSDKLPGIVFTPSRSQRYYVCAHWVWSTNGGNFSEMQLSDLSSTVISAQGQEQPAGSINTLGATCGIYRATDTASKTIRMETKSNPAGTVTVGVSSVDVAIEWSIFALDQSFPAPLLVGSVTSNSSGVERLERVNVNAPSGGLCAVTSESGDWINGTPTSSGTGICSLVFNSNIFSGTPTCICTTRDGTATCGGSTGATISGVTLTAISDVGLGTNQKLDIVCVGPR